MLKPRITRISRIDGLGFSQPGKILRSCTGILSQSLVDRTKLAVQTADPAFKHAISRGVLTAAVAVVLLAPGKLTAQAPDAGEDIRPAKPLVEMVQPQKPPLARWLGIGGAVVALAIAALWWRRHRRRQRLKSPAETALWSLAELAVNREVLAAEAFANRAAQTVRQYIAERFGLAAPRRTTEEFLRDLTTAEGSALIGESDHLRVFLKSCDLAKFAASPLDASQRGELIQAARGFVTATSVPRSNKKPEVTTP